MKLPYQITSWPEFQHWFWHHSPMRVVRRLGWQLAHRLHPSHRYHVVKTDLRPGYYDVDTLMLETWMKLLRRYVEDEHGGAKEFSAWIAQLRANLTEDDLMWWVCASVEQVNMEEEALVIYNWWMGERKAAWEALEQAIDAAYGDWEQKASKAEVAVIRELEQNIHDQDQAMLIRLAKIRRSLWT